MNGLNLISPGYISARYSISLESNSRGQRIFVFSNKTYDIARNRLRAAIQETESNEQVELSRVESMDAATLERAAR